MKAQLSADFVISIIFVLFVLLLTLAVHSGWSTNANYEENYLKGKELAYGLARSINSIGRAGNGTRSQFFVPEGYFVYISYPTVLVDWDSGSASAPLLTSVNSTNITSQMSLTIRNENGTVYFDE